MWFTFETVGHHHHMTSEIPRGTRHKPVPDSHGLQLQLIFKVTIVVLVDSVKSYTRENNLSLTVKLVFGLSVKVWKQLKQG